MDFRGYEMAVAEMKDRLAAMRSEAEKVEAERDKYKALAERYAGIRVLTFEIENIERPGRVYVHPAYDGRRRMIVALSPPHERYPIRFLYVNNMDEALALAREIGVAHVAGNVDVYVARHEREIREARAKAAHDAEG